MSAGRRLLGIVTDGSAPGLMKYGLHRELPSSSEDEDFNPSMCSNSSDSDYNKNGKLKSTRKSKKRRISSSSNKSSSESTAILSDDETSKQSTSKKPHKRKFTNERAEKTNPHKKKNENNKVSKKPRQKSRKFGDVIDYSKDDSEDDDYVPEGSPIKKKEKKVRSKDFASPKAFASETYKNYDPLKAREDTWASLPAEILSQIFHTLSKTDCKGVQHVIRCSAVCKWWNNVAKQPMSWDYADLAFIGGSSKANDDLLASLCESMFTNLKELKLTGWKKLTDIGLLNVASNCHKLESLNIAHCQKTSVSKISGNSLIPVAENCVLKNIDFSNLRIGTNYSKTALKLFEICGENLTHINFSGNLAFGSIILSSILRTCTSLLTLDVSNTAIRGICFDTLQSSLPKLQELYLANLQLEPKPLKDKTNKNGFTYLTICSLATTNNSRWLTDEIFIKLLQSSTHLKILDIRGQVLSEAAYEIPSTSLERLYMSRCKVTNKKISDIISRKWSNTLWDLDLSWVEPVGIPFDRFMEQLLKPPNCCNKISHLNIVGTAVTDSVVKLIVKVCSKLTYLDLTSCRGVQRGIKRKHEHGESIIKLKEFYNNI